MSKQTDAHITRGFRTRLVLACLCPALGYTFVRYALLKDVAFQQWPLYLVNKAISLSAVGLLALSYLIRRWRWLRPAHPVRTLAVIQFCGLGGLWLVGVHVTLSLAILSPDYFPKFFEHSKLSFAGELSMLCGVLALWCYVLPAMATLPQTRQALGAQRWRRYQQVGYAALVLVIVHLAAMGFPQWFAPLEWPGYMPPISMLGAALALAPLVARLLGSRRKEGQRAQRPRRAKES